MFLNRLGLKQ